VGVVILRFLMLESDDLEAFKDADGRVRGILTTSSYEARAFGVKTAMNISDALRLCPNLIIKAPNMSLFQKLSHELHEYLTLKIPLIEQASIDEFYGDLSGWIEDDGIPKDIGLPVSIGAASTRYIAKLATTFAKPFGCKIITKHNFDAFINPMPVREFAGIGRSMANKLASAQIFTLGELRQRRGTIESWGPYAKELYKRINAEVDAPIKTTHKRKSIGISRTFDAIYDRVELRRRVHVLSRHLNFAILKLDVIPTVFSLNISYDMNQSSHKNISLSERFTEKKFDSLCQKMFQEADIHKRLQVIRIGINCSSFTRDSKKELSLLNFEQDAKMEHLTKETQKIREKYGLDALKWGSEL